MCSFLSFPLVRVETLVSRAHRCAHKVHFVAFEPQFLLLENSVISVLPAFQGYCDDQTPQRNKRSVLGPCVDDRHGFGEDGAVA